MVTVDEYNSTILFFIVLMVGAVFLIAYLWKHVGVDVRYCPSCHTKLVISPDGKKRQCPNCKWVSQD